VQQDSVTTKRLDEVTIQGEKEVNVERLPDIEGTRIWSGKKNEPLTIKNLDANIAEKTARQVFAKVPGVFVYDMDGTGNQINIARRGLDPDRYMAIVWAIYKLYP
jgi:Fe(3+) dicitrate transport protein